MSSVKDISKFGICVSSPILTIFSHDRGLVGKFDSQIDDSFVKFMLNIMFNFHLVLIEISWFCTLFVVDLLRFIVIYSLSGKFVLVATISNERINYVVTHQVEKPH